MIEAVFFDWFNTLAKYSPPREELQSRLLGEFGINVGSTGTFNVLNNSDITAFNKSIFKIRM